MSGRKKQSKGPSFESAWSTMLKAGCSESELASCGDFEPKLGSFPAGISDTEAAGHSQSHFVWDSFPARPCAGAVGVSWFLASLCECPPWQHGIPSGDPEAEPTGTKNSIQQQQGRALPKATISSAAAGRILKSRLIAHKVLLPCHLLNVGYTPKISIIQVPDSTGKCNT